jgi:DNA repair photolyase
MTPSTLFPVAAPARPRPPRPLPAPDPAAAELPRAAYAALPPTPGGAALSRYVPAPGARELPFEWTLNPYRGCEIGCGYCYARYVHGFLGLDDPRDFERRIFGKEDLPRLLARDLERRVAPGQRIALGTATDPYQPVEREREITRECLRVLARASGLRLSVTTKSDLVLRDLDLLRVIARRSSLHVNVTITTVDRRLARVLEPRAVTPARRLAAVRALAAEGIETGVFLMPVLPCLTDLPGMPESVARDAAAAGARYLCHRPVFLREPSLSHWLSVLAASFPALVRAYREGFAGRAEGDPGYRPALSRRMERVRRRHRLAAGPSDRAPPSPQLTLAFPA